MSRHLLLFPLFFSACAVTPEQGDWLLDSPKWTSSVCSEELLGNVPAGEQVPFRVSEQELFAEAGSAVIACEKVGPRSYNCDPLLLAIGDVPGMDASLSWTAAYTADFWGPDQGKFDVHVEGLCNGSDCDTILADPDPYEPDAGCEAWGEQRVNR